MVKEKVWTRKSTRKKRKVLIESTRITKATTNTEDEPKPGTIGSKQIIKPKRGPSLPERVALANKRMLDYKIIDTKGYVDESIICFMTEFGQMQGLGKKQLPKDPTDFCMNFAIPINDMGSIEPVEDNQEDEQFVDDHPASPQSTCDSRSTSNNVDNISSDTLEEESHESEIFFSPTIYISSEESSS